MMAATHRLGGLAAGMAVAVVLHTEPTYTGVIIGSAVLGSLIPDIDNPHSRISRKWRLASIGVTIGQTIIRGISAFFPTRQRNYIRSLIGHRGITHSLIPVILLWVIASMVGEMCDETTVACYIGVGLIGGVLSHILFDMFAGGVPLFIPFSVKRICLAHIKTGGTVEWILRMIMIVVFVLCGMEVIPWQR